jgi:UDP-N-acetyl-D-mannosaminuronic acid dehydrogenase
MIGSRGSRVQFKSGGAADLCIIGGAGHVGLPMAILFASKGLKVIVHDIDEAALERLATGQMPFVEEGAEPLLHKVLADGTLAFTSSLSHISEAPTVIVTIGTPVDEYLNPVIDVVRRLANELSPHLSTDQLLIFRSTLCPGTMDWLVAYLKENGPVPLLAYCPERIVQGRAILELQQLPQIVSGVTPEAEEAAARFFSQISPSVVRLSPLEAEFAKLFCNAYRYIQFAATNQFYVIANSAGVDYSRVVKAVRTDYDRMTDFPGAGLAAGPCLFKDTMQLLAASNNKFFLGHVAVLANEGLANYLVERMQERWPLRKKVVGLLGMAFKANIDDVRSSLSYKLKRLLRFACAEVLTTDPLVTKDTQLLPLDEVINRSDILVLCVPHDAYRGLDTKGKPVLDVWGFFGKGCLI